MTQPPKMETENNPLNRRAFDNWKVVGPWPRFFGFAIDGLFAAFLVLGGCFLFRIAPQSPKFLYLWILTLWAWEGLWLTLTGTTPGRKPFGISVYSPRMDGIPHPMQVCLRILTFWISFLMLGIGLTPILFRRDRRGWHDLISETLTVGHEKSVPAPVAQKFGQSLLLFQSLIVFSTFGALLLTSGTGSNALLRSEINTSCENRDYLLNRTSEVLFALAVSPAWNECLPRLQSRLGPIGDSQLAKMALLATHYYELWTQPIAIRNGLYSRTIRPLEDAVCKPNHGYDDVCKTARHLASVTAAVDDQIASEPSWLGKYNDVIINLIHEKDLKKRMETLKHQYEAAESPIVKSALGDRLWAEQLAIGSKPESLPNSLNQHWNSDQYCWAESLGLSSTHSCRSNDPHETVDALKSLSKGVDPNEVRDRISRLETSLPNSEVNAILEAWSAKSKGNLEVANERLSELSILSPIRSIASQLFPQ